MKLLQDLGSIKPTPTSNYTKRYGIYECPICEGEIRTITADVVRGKVTKCRSCAATLSKTTHGGTNTILFSRWKAMKQRCYNTNADNYKWYGEKGIKVCDEWKNSYEAFRDWAMQNGYTDKLTIDRRDEGKDYGPDNCTWETWFTQQQNKGIGKLNTSGYKGVSFNKSRKLWQTAITSNRVRIHLGLHTTPEEAALAYNNYVIKNSLRHRLNQL